jgi:hypothetical protein
MDASPGSLEANGTDTSTITIRIVDSSAYPQPNVSVTFTSDLGAITPSSAVTDASGEATTVLRAGYEAGTASVVCRAADLNLMGTKLVTIYGGEPAFISTSLVVPAITLPATNGLPSPSGASPSGLIYARVTDQYGNAVRDGTQVQFTTDIGQITASAPTVAGVANATLVSCNFADATNRATYRPGVSTINVSSDTHGGKVSDGPFHVVFSGDLATTHALSGVATQTNLLTDCGADWRGDVAGGYGSQPGLTPVAGTPIFGTIYVYDANDNPLPAGIPVNWVVKDGGYVVAQGTATTGMTNDIMQAGGCDFQFKYESFQNNPTKALLTVSAEASAVVNTRVALAVTQWVGAAEPKSCTQVSSPCGNTWQVGAGYTFACAVEAKFVDAYNNRVQDGNGVIWTAENVVNVSYQFLPSYSGTSNGQGTTVLSVTLLDPESGGGLTVKAAAANDPDNVFSTMPISVVPPPP